MAISKVASGQAAAATITLESTGIANGDLVIIHAYRSGSNTVPSSPSNGKWTDISTSTGANTNSRRIGYRIIQAGDALASVVGTWTSATAIQFIAFRGFDTLLPIGNTASGGSNTTTLTTPSLTLLNTGGLSWVVAFAGSKATNANSVTLAGTTGESSTQGALNLATGRGVTSWASANYSATVNASANRMDVVEIIGAVTGTGTATNNQTFNGTGGLTFTGSGAATNNQTVSGSGTQTFSGSGTATNNQAVSGSGTQTFSGTGTATNNQTFSGTGSLIFSGDATATNNQTVSGTGAQTFTGTGSASNSQSVSGTGALEFTGTATASNSQTVSGDGGQLFTGTATASNGQTVTGSGELLFTGTATASNDQSIAGSGSQLFEGSGLASNDQDVVGYGGQAFLGYGSASNDQTFSGDGGQLFTGDATASNYQTFVGYGTNSPPFVPAPQQRTLEAPANNRALTYTRNSSISPPAQIRVLTPTSIRVYTVPARFGN